VKREESLSKNKKGSEKEGVMGRTFTTKRMKNGRAGRPSEEGKEGLKLQTGRYGRGRPLTIN